MPWRPDESVRRWSTDDRGRFKAAFRCVRDPRRQKSRRAERDYCQKGSHEVVSGQNPTLQQASQTARW
jgi:hypothetical protein